MPIDRVITPRLEPRARPIDREQNAGVVIVGGFDANGFDAGPVLYPAVVLADGPCGYWRFEERGGSTTFADSTVHGNPLIGAGTLVPGSSGAFADGDLALGTNNGGAYVNDNPTIATLTDMTAELWYRAANGYAGMTPLLSNLNGDFLTGFDLAVSGDVVVFQTGNGTTTTGSIPVGDGGWHYIVGTVTGATVSIYVDGILDISQQQVGLSIDNATQRFAVSNNIVAGFGHGVFDEVALYQFALTGAQIAAHDTAARSVGFSVAPWTSVGVRLVVAAEQRARVIGTEIRTMVER